LKRYLHHVALKIESEKFTDPNRGEGLLCHLPPVSALTKYKTRKRTVVMGVTGCMIAPRSLFNWTPHMRRTSSRLTQFDVKSNETVAGLDETRLQ